MNGYELVNFVIDEKYIVNFALGRGAEAAVM